MNRDLENLFRTSIHELHFSSEEKERMYRRLLRSGSVHPVKEREEEKMKKWTLPKVAAVAAACLMVTGVSAFAASRMTTYVASSNGEYDYTSVSDINKASASSEIPDFPETLGNGFRFDGGNTVNVAGKDDAGNTLGKWDDLCATYQNDDGRSVNLSLSPYVSEDGDSRTPTETRTISGITVNYNYDEYLFLPDEKEELDADVKKRMETDDHFYVSYGTDTPETTFYSSATFTKDGISYDIFSSDEVSAKELFAIAEELITQ